MGFLQHCHSVAVPGYKLLRPPYLVVHVINTSGTENTAFGCGKTQLQYSLKKQFMPIVKLPLPLKLVQAIPILSTYWRYCPTPICTPKGPLLKCCCLQLPHRSLWGPWKRHAFSHGSHLKSSPSSSRRFCIHPLPKTALLVDHPLSSLIANEEIRKDFFTKQRKWPSN